MYNNYSGRQIQSLRVMHLLRISDVQVQRGEFHFECRTIYLISKSPSLQRFSAELQRSTLSAKRPALIRDAWYGCTLASGIVHAVCGLVRLFTAIDYRCDHVDISIQRTPTNLHRRL